ncbi:thermonuclease family protein [Rothia sp. P4278]|uniref:thermonuclease family protein n=1 Tax=Rothia sp. P4278 TaxID=3402658 RepID=UPI003AD8F7F3
MKRVVDGDTFDVSYKGQDTRVRLLNVDTPETKHPNKIVECLGPEATEYLEEMLPEGSRVTLEFDVEKIDKYGRTLAGVYKDGGEFVNAEIARKGLGVAVKFEPNSKFYQSVLAAQQEAESQQRGLFDTSIGCNLSSQINDVTNSLEKAEGIQEIGSAITEADSLISLSDENVGDESHTYLVSLLRSASLSQSKDKVVHLRAKAKQRYDQRKADMKAEAEKKRQAEADRVAAEQAARLEAERLAAEQAAQAEADRVAAEQAARLEAERLAAEQAAQAEAERQAQQYVPPAPAPNPNPEPHPAQSQEPPAPAQEPYPGYTGPRCYAPGGKTWTPCPQK